MISPFQYILPLISVVIGIALSDVALSLHRLIRARDRVRWDWLPLFTAVIGILAVLQVWWAFYHSQNTDFYETLYGFLPFAAQLLTLVLLNAASLPDRIPEEGLDMRAFYEKSAPYFWSAYAFYLFLVVAHRVGARLMNGLPEGVGVGGVLWKATGFLPIILFFLALAWFRNRLVHSIVIPFVLLVLLLELNGLRL